MEKTGHYEHWREDFELVVEMGIPFLRYGPPYYATHLGPGCYDWSFADATFRVLSELGITPIADLCHIGVPDWLGDFQNPDFPYHFGEYDGGGRRGNGGWLLAARAGCWLTLAIERASLARVSAV